MCDLLVQSREALDASCMVFTTALFIEMGLGSSFFLRDT